MPKTNLKLEIMIHALPSKVWSVLTRSDYVSQYFFDEHVECDWKEGSPLLLSGTEQKKGEVMQVVPGVLLRYSLPENHDHRVIISYEPIPISEGVDLQLKCEGFSDSEEAYQLRSQQLKLILQKIKWLAEYS
jgi:uncharacterized protein YndB with AHSA1/START domain